MATVTQSSLWRYNIPHRLRLSHAISYDYPLAEPNNNTYGEIVIYLISWRDW